MHTGHSRGALGVVVMSGTMLEDSLKKEDLNKHHKSKTKNL